jgi:multidrug efflux pump subunit AcrA (membrane-fusion protein)
VKIKASSKTEVLAVPTAAVQRQKNEQIVFVDAGNGVFQRREVKTGTRSRDMIEIFSGLAPGDKVVTQGSFTLKSELEKAGFADHD